MWAARAGSRRDFERGVAIDARALAVTRHAQSCLRACFERVSRAKTRAMQTGEAYVVESETRGQRGDHADPVTPSALPLAMTGRAKIARARRAYAVFAHPIAVMHEMADR